MKLQFEAEKLISDLGLIKVLPAPRAVINEDMVGLRAHQGTLTAYAYAKHQFARIILLNHTAEEDGIYMVQRSRLFQLLGSLKGDVKFRPSTNTKVPNRAELSSKQGKFTLVAFREPTVPIMRLGDNITRSVVPAKELHRLLKLCILDGELLGGGYSVSRKKGMLEILVSDGLRLLLARMKCPGGDFEFLVESSAIKGVFEMLKLSSGGEITLGSDKNVSCLELSAGDIYREFGFTKPATSMPNVNMILNAPAAPNKASFDVAELLEAVERSIIAADKELAFADFQFDGETCQLSTMTDEASADVVVDSFAEIEDEGNSILRLRLDFVRAFLRKIKEAGDEKVTVTWGEKLPVNWYPDWNPDENQDIDFRLICTALNRQGVTMA